MGKDLKSRLRELAWDVTSIGNFNYASQYGYKVKDIILIAEGISRDLSGVYDLMGSSYPILEILSENALEDVDLSKIREWERQVKKVLTTLRSDPEYKRLRVAYRNNDQIQVSETLPNVFVNYEIQTLIEPNQKSPRLSHGITVPEGMNAEQYLEFCLKISREGLKPSPYGIHMEMDRNIRPIYSATRPLDAHGLIALTFTPESHAVVIDNNKKEAKIYSPKLQANFEFTLRDIDTLTSYGPDDGVVVPNDQIGQYLKDLEEGLTIRKIPFKKVKIPKS